MIMQVPQRGIVKWFDADKGFGFITPVDGGPDIFVAARAIIGRGYRYLNPEQLVEFNTEAGSQGPQAVAVQPVVNGN